MERDRTLRSLGVTASVLAVAALVLTGVAVWLAVANPTITGTSRGDHTCLAPWDTVLNDASNAPGGEPPPDAADIDERCREAGEQRFDAAVAVGVAAGVVALAAGAVGVVRHRRDRRPTA